MKRTRIFNVVSMILLNGLLVTATHAGSVAGFGGSTEITQILNNIELVNQSAQMYQQVQQTLQQVMMEKQQLQNPIAAPTQTWGQAQQELAAQADLVNKTAALS